MSAKTTHFPVIFVQSEPRVSHLALADRLGMRRHKSARDIVERHRAEFESYGLVAQRRTPIVSGKGGTQDTVEYLLNEHQALLVCMFSQTSAAAAVRKQLIDTFMAVRNGQAVGAVVAPASDGRIRHRKVAYAMAYAALLEIGIDPATFDHSNVRAYAKALISARDAF